MDEMRVLVGNEPRVYRDIHATSLQALRPEAEVVAVEPAELDEAVRRLEPDVVFCSRLSETVESEALSWVLLYPDGANLAIVCIAGERTIVPEIAFEALLGVLDETERRLAAQHAS
jgi:hypothetical protein